jgi:hypothetical protein
LAKGLEEQLGAGLGQRDEAQFIDDEKLIAEKYRCAKFTEFLGIVTQPHKFRRLS